MKRNIDLNSLEQLGICGRTILTIFLSRTGLGLELCPKIEIGPSAPLFRTGCDLFGENRCDYL